ncbi:HTTM domain-containing protein [Microbacterium sp. GXF6406]
MISSAIISARLRSEFADMAWVNVIRRVPGFLWLMVTHALRGIGAGLSRLLGFCEEWLTGRKHAQYGTAIMRIVLGLVGLGLLFSNFAARSYLYGPAATWTQESVDPQAALPRVWLFSIVRHLSHSMLFITLVFIVLAVLAALIVVGWRIRLVLPVYFVLWVSLIETNDAVSDQSDNVYRICLFFLFFADSARRLSLDARRREKAGYVRGGVLVRAWKGAPVLPEWLTNAAHNLVLVILTAQVSIIYASGGLYKASGTLWEQGIAVYGPLQTQLYGSSWPWLSELATTWGPAVVIASWGSIILQVSFPFMLMNRFTRVIALLGIVGFHISIAVLMGLPWFSLAMISIDAIFVRDRTWLAIGHGVTKSWRSTADQTAEQTSEQPAEQLEPVGTRRSARAAEKPATEPAASI